MKTKEFELGKMLGNKKLGKVTFNLDVNSSHYENQYPSVLLKLVAPLITATTITKISLWMENTSRELHGKSHLG